MRANERKQKQQAFLDAYRNGVSVRGACERSGVARSTVYKWADTDPVFKAQFDECSEDVNDSIDDEIMRRGKEGWDEPVASAGKQVYTREGEPLMIRRHSDQLLILLAKSRMPKYRDKQQIDMTAQITTMAENAKAELLADLAANLTDDTQDETH